MPTAVLPPPLNVPPSASPLPPVVPPRFLDVEQLLDQSQPQYRPIWARYSLLFFVAVLVGAAYFTSQAGQWTGVAQLASSALMFLLILAMFVTSTFTVRSQRREQQQLENIEELIQLRRWPEAGMAVQNLLLQPTRTAWGRVQGLIYLSGVLMRYHRFSDAIRVQEFLLDGLPLDGATVQSLQLGRAMSMLRDDRLVDADQAINELRRTAMRAHDRKNSDAAAESIDAAESNDPSVENNPAFNSNPSAVASPIESTITAHWKTTRATRTHASAGLALIELYRDVMTGHPEEAIEIFTSKLPLLRKQLGHRVADAYVLAARAYDLLGDAVEASRHYAAATLLAPVAELHRRFPETAVLAVRYVTSAAPRVPMTV